MPRWTINQCYRGVLKIRYNANLLFVIFFFFYAENEGLVQADDIEAEQNDFPQWQNEKSGEYDGECEN